MTTSTIAKSPWVATVSENRVLSLLLSTALGVALLAALSRVAIPLPGTPVPVTGQTFGVALLALLWGRTRGLTAVGTYLGLGFAGLPMFATAHLPFVVSPTTGYLVGMLAGAALMGTLADRGWTRRWVGAYAAAVLGSVCVFTFGMAGLAFFIPAGKVLAAGWIPFIPGDVLKTVTAATVAYRAARLQAPQA